MNFTLGEKVKIVGNETLFEIMGFESKTRYNNGTTEERKEYILQNPKNRLFFRVDEEEVISKETNAIDHLLDKYNDYKTLFNLFGEAIYQEKMLMTIEKLKNIQNKKRA